MRSNKSREIRIAAGCLFLRYWRTRFSTSEGSFTGSFAKTLLSPGISMAVKRQLLLQKQLKNGCRKEMGCCLPVFKEPQNYGPPPPAQTEEEIERQRLVRHLLQRFRKIQNERLV
jgi:hypothetical protein